MVDRPLPRSIRRAQWLAELSEALEEAHRLTLRLAEWSADSSEAVALRNRIQAMRAEVDALRRHTPARASGMHPLRTKTGQDWLSELVELTRPGEGPRRR